MNFEKLFGKQVIIKLLFYLLLSYANQNVFLLFLYYYYIIFLESHGDNWTPPPLRPPLNVLQLTPTSLVEAILCGYIMGSSTFIKSACIVLPASVSVVLFFYSACL